MTRPQLPLPVDLQRHPELTVLLPLPLLLETARRALIGAHDHIWNEPERPLQGRDASVLHLVGELAELADLIEAYVDAALDDDDSVPF